MRRCDSGVERFGPVPATGSDPGGRCQSGDAPASAPFVGDVIANWHTDVKIAFTWLREALLQPLPPGGRVIVVSSGAAINGSPASGGYAGAKATQRFIAGYAHEEARLSGLDITVTAVMPRMTPFGDIGRRGIRAYAARSGQSEHDYLEKLGRVVTPELAGSVLVDLVRQDSTTIAPDYLLTGDGLQRLP